ncbi:MAG: hypothetical protein ACFFD1_03080 [Candidatus Thorarchaeota archaeon]
MSQPRPRRRVVPRRAPVRAREEIVEEQERPAAKTILEKFDRLSPNSKIYYLKLIASFIIGIPAGALYTIQDIANNWFLIPIIALIVVVLFVRFGLKMDESQVSWARLILSGTITLFISFIVVSAVIWMIFFGNISALTAPNLFYISL